MWHLVADGEPIDTCGIPQAYHEFLDGSKVWGPQQCTRRLCSKCADHRYVVDAADDIARTVLGWCADLISDGKMYDDQGRSLKIYHYIYSRKKLDDNLKAARKAAHQAAREAGMIAGFHIVHPYRGKHGRHDPPDVIRASMNRNRLSIHIHAVGIGYWTEPHKGPDVLEITKIDDVRNWAHGENELILTRDILVSKLQYDLNHAGWWENGQCSSQWGQLGEPRYKPEQPGIWIAHPTDTYEGEQVWERRKKPTEEAWDELSVFKQAAWLKGGKPDWNLLIPHGMSVGGIAPWYRLDMCDTMPDHTTWHDWRATMVEVVTRLIEAQSAPADDQSAEKIKL